jgi:hypothetical protein
MHFGVTVRITTFDESRGRVVRVDGWLFAGDVAALEEAVGDRVRGTRLELADLRSADPAGVVALRTFAARGARLHGAAPFLRLLLGQGANGDPPSEANHE